MIKNTMNIILKILIIFLIYQTVNIPTTNAGYLDNTITNANKFISDGKKEAQASEAVDNAKLKETSDNIYNTLFAIGIVLSIIVGGILGIQLMWGSVEQQVKAKEMLMPFAVGCIVTFGAFGIWKICVNIFSQL